MGYAGLRGQTLQALEELIRGFMKGPKRIERKREEYLVIRGHLLSRGPPHRAPREHTTQTPPPKYDTANGEEPTTSTDRPRPSSQSSKTRSSRRALDWKLGLTSHHHLHLPGHAEQAVPHRIVTLSVSNTPPNAT
jgi:hypothetical protein